MENDARSEIKIKDLLNMRSSLVPICRNDENGVTTPIICTSFPSSGGDLIPFPNLNEICINRVLKLLYSHGIQANLLGKKDIFYN